MSNILKEPYKIYAIKKQIPQSGNHYILYKAEQLTTADSVFIDFMQLKLI